jgi:superfamily II DNA helicase RecQ
MQVKIFTVSAEHPEAGLKELNAFLRGNRILTVSESFHTGAGYWSYSVRYLQRGKAADESAEPEKKDYKKILDEETFAWYSELRRRRKELSDELSLPAYVIFNNAELAEIARLGREVTPEDLAKIDGVGKAKIKKYGTVILNRQDEDGS